MIPTSERIGKTYGSIKVLAYDHKDKNRNPYVKCECLNCGRKFVTRCSCLDKISSDSIGCQKCNKPIEDLTNQRFGMLVAEKLDHVEQPGGAYWLFRCDCNKTIVARSNLVKMGSVRSCGCTKRTDSKEVGEKMYPDKILLLRRIYASLLERCGHSEIAKIRYKCHAGKGIDVCDEWRKNRDSFINWSLNNGFESHLSFDRIDNRKGYNPENCRWVELKEQYRNMTTNRHIVVDGIDYLVTEWSKLLPLFRLWLSKKFVKHRRMRDAGEYTKSSAYSNEEASEQVMLILKNYAKNFLDMEGYKTEDVVDVLKEAPNAIKFVTLQGKCLTVAQWFKRLNLTVENLKAVGKLQLFEIEYFLKDAIDRNINKVS